MLLYFLKIAVSNPQPTAYITTPQGVSGEVE